MRKLATAAAVSLALASGGAYGLGLGDIEMQSALNQPMDAEIPLTSVKPGELDGMIVQLASPEAFTRAGIERSTALTDLTFTVDESSGEPVIKIESARPVIEPFLNFLLEVDWPQGRMVREYTVLLDPPVFMSSSASERNVAADQPAVVEGGEAALVVPTPIERDIDVGDEGVIVDLGELEDESTEEILSLDEATSDSLNDIDGELVTLGELSSNSSPAGGVAAEALSDESLLSNEISDAEDALSDAEGEVVSLIDLGAPNTDADDQREQVAAQSFDTDNIQVETAGSTDEVTDDIVIGEDGEPVDAEVDDSDSTIVSLDDLEDVAPVEISRSGETVTVSDGDTMYEISRDNAPSGISIQQMMMAMLAVNESAFINNNINLVRAGSILRIPEESDATKLTQAQALAAISDQNQLWQDYRDSLRSASGTQIAQNFASDSDASESIESASLDTDSSLDGLSEEARAILNSAREEVQNGEELNIVADNSPSSTTASATADETTDSDAARVGEVNLQLKLAREELAATRMRSDDLNDQASELQNTTDSLDSMVSLRQNEVARLESQLADAREAAQEQEQLEADNASQAVSDAASEAGEVVTEGAGDAVDAAQSVIADAGETAEELAGGVAEGAESAVDAVEEAGSNALTEAGETLGEVELVSPETDVAVEGTVDTDVAMDAGARTWYQDFLDDPRRMAIAGIGALGLFGVLGTLLFRRKKRQPVESRLDAIDEAEFNNDTRSVADTKIVEKASARMDDTAAFAAAGAVGAGAAGAGAVGAAAALRGDAAEDDVVDSTMAFGAQNDMGALPADYDDDDGGDDSIDKDDTISEVDVYLAYGLHGQAEELLTKAIQRTPENSDYACKLLQTYHAQGKGDAFHEGAADFHQRFGGDENPRWQSIAAMGSELAPANPLYIAAAAGAVARVGTGSVGGAVMGDDDFTSFNTTEKPDSVSRDFGASSASVDLKDDESALLDTSIDPAFAFDEGDLEATGDFSAIADELSAENGSGDFPGMGDATSGDALTMDELDGLSDSVDDLTLDLDQLSGDLELDSAELLSSDLSDLDIPDLTADNDLLLDSSGAMGGDDGDEMDTMMDLAKAYIDMGDKDSASSALGEIVKSGSPEQVTEAETLLRKIS